MIAKPLLLIKLISRSVVPRPGSPAHNRSMRELLVSVSMLSTGSQLQMFQPIMLRGFGLGLKALVLLHRTAFLFVDHATS